MQVILTKNHENLGSQGDAVNVKPGYFRNYLQLQGLAVIATESNLKHHAVLSSQRGKKIEKEKHEQKTIADKLSNTLITVKAKAGANGKLFGAVTTRQIAMAIKEATGYEIYPNRIRISEPIKSDEGTPVVNVKLFHGVQAPVKIKVEASIEKEQDAENKIKLSRKKRTAILLDVVKQMEQDDETIITVSTGIEGDTSLSQSDKKRKKRRAAEERSEAEAKETGDQEQAVDSEEPVKKKRKKKSEEESSDDEE